MATYGCGYDGIQIKAAENGFIVTSGGSTWVFASIEPALKFIKQSFAEEKK